MYGKQQESGLTEIIPLICISAILGSVSCVFFTSWVPQCSPQGVTAVWGLPDWAGILLLPECPGGLESCMTVTSFSLQYSCLRKDTRAEEPGGLQNSLVGYSLQGHKRAGHDFATKKQQQQTDQMTRAQVMSSK